MDDRALLQHLSDGAVSGARLAAAAGVTRAAIWKRIQALRQAGVAISAGRGGYCLEDTLDLLDVDALLASLSPAARAHLDTLEVQWEVASTNTTLLQRAPPARGCAVLLAERQTGGRGRHGRAWASPLGSNLYCSVSRRFEGGLARLGGLALAVGVAVADALRGRGVPAQLKWPNDLLLDGRKLGGLLVEGAGEHAGHAHVVMGLGLNVAMPVAVAAGIDQPWSDLRQSGIVRARQDWAADVLGALLPALDAFERNGLAGVLPRWQALDALHGQAVIVHDGGRTRGGIACGIAEDGGLRIRVGDKEERVHAGEVSVRPA